MENVIEKNMVIIIFAIKISGRRPGNVTLSKDPFLRPPLCFFLTLLLTSLCLLLLINLYFEFENDIIEYQFTSLVSFQTFYATENFWKLRRKSNATLRSTKFVLWIKSKKLDRDQEINVLRHQYFKAKWKFTLVTTCWK